MSSVCTSESMKALERKAELVGKCERAIAQLSEAGVDVSDICCGCRCGWLCCDCFLGCISCKQLRSICYCRWTAYFQRQNEIRHGIPTGNGHYSMCMFCQLLRPQCQCQEKRRCKWCVVSLQKCKRGGCLHRLPERYSSVAQLYVDIFNVEDGPDDDDLPAGAQVGDRDRVKKGDDDAGKEGQENGGETLTPTASPSTSSVMSDEYDSSSGSTANSDGETSSIGGQGTEDKCSKLEPINV